MRCGPRGMHYVAAMHGFLVHALLLSILQGVSCQRGLFRSISKSELAGVEATSDDIIVTLVTKGYENPGVQLVKNLRRTGDFEGDIVILSDGLPDHELSRLFENIVKKESQHGAWVVQATDLIPKESAHGNNVPRLPCNNNFIEKRNRLGKKRVRGWRAYYLKTVIFNQEFFSRWKRVLYMDSRMKIHRSVKPIFDEIDCSGVLMANPDPWPHNMDQWKLGIQFWPECDRALYKSLGDSYNLEETYFQSGVLFFDTAILEEDTWLKLSNLYHKYAVISSGDQAIFSLYFHNIKHQYKPLPYRLDKSYQIPYDFGKRSLSKAHYIITAWGEDSLFCPPNPKNPAQGLQLLKPIDLPPVDMSVTYPSASCDCSMDLNVTCGEHTQKLVEQAQQIQELTEEIRKLSLHARSKRSNTLNFAKGDSHVSNDIYLRFTPSALEVETEQWVHVFVPALLWMLFVQVCFVGVMWKFGILKVDLRTCQRRLR